jgi:amidohydrolase
MSTPDGLSDAKRRVCAAVDAMAVRLLAVSRQVHSHPELAHHERRAAALLADQLDRGGLAVERTAYGLPTALAGRAGVRGPLVVVCCEYDALPGLGHACGHNVIAAAGLGAGLALAALAAPLGGRVAVLGTPAEEGGGGKILLAGRGAFSGAAAAMLVHPSSYETVMPPINAVATLEATLLGRASHASMYPERGVNALDAFVLGYLGLAALRQHLAPTDKVHGVVTDGGTVPNVVPARAAGRFMIRSATQAELHRLQRRVLACLQGGAEAAGARLVARWPWPAYREMRHNQPLAASFEANVRALGRRPLAPSQVPASRAGSTDMGDVSQLVPAIHPFLAISPPDVVPHSRAFAAWASGPAADRAVLDGAKALAMTAMDVWLRPPLRAAMHAAFEAVSGASGASPDVAGRDVAPSVRTVSGGGRAPAGGRHVARPGAVAAPDR